MNIKKNNRVIITSLIGYILVYFLLVFTVLPKYSYIINFIFLSVICLSAFMMYKYKKIEFDKLTKRVIRIVFISILMFFTIIYLLGLFTGYGRSIFSIGFLSIIKNTLIPFISVILMELFRYLFVSNNRDNKRAIRTITILLILFDIVLNMYIFDLTLNDFFIFLTVTVVPIIFKNIMLTFISKNTNYLPCLIYVIPLCLYKYIILFKPNLGNYLNSVMFIALPAFIYIHSSRTINNIKNENNNKISIIRIIRIFILDIPLTIFFTIFIGLISGYFRYHLIGVESSYINHIDKGDAIMIDRGFLYNKYQKGDIIAYKDGNKNIIAEVSKVELDESGYTKVFITEQINTISEDKYKEINKKSVLGKYVDFKIKYIAKPTVWFKETVTDME